VSSSKGAYAIIPKDVATLSRSASTDGIVNLEVDAFDNGRGDAFFFPRKLVTTSAGAVLAANIEARTPQLSPQIASLSINLTHALPAASAVASPRTCGENVPIAKWKNKSVVLGGEWSRLDSVYMYFTYSQQSSSTLGAGLDPLTGGGWQGSGTYSITAGSSQNWPIENKADGYNRKSNFTYTEYRESCVGDTTHVTNWDGSNGTKKVGFLPAHNCEYEAATPGQPTVTLNNTTAWTYSSGVSIADDIGINLSAQTGYTTTASEQYWFTDTKHHRYLCGRTGPPNGTNPPPGYVVAGPSAKGDG
jgi:hypothetical protein